MIDTTTPLSERMRPENLEEFVGQDHLLGTGKLLRRMMEGDELYSIILWGPPGTGKTTLAHIIAAASHSLFMPLSAVTSSIKEVREIIAQAIKDKKENSRQTILFVDEIHRFNKAQQDAFLPHVERGDIVFIGATTENPSFEVISPLLSRTKVLVLKALTDASLKTILKRALADADKGLGYLGVQAGDDVLEHIIAYAQGDARVALNTLEIAAGIAPAAEGGMRELTQEIVEEALQKKILLYDKGGEEHYNIISARHKSMRNSDADASLYWLARMLEAGEDPLYIARRLVRFASEDIGNADPKALQIALEAKEAFHFIGLPEGKLALAQATIYMATAPKSNALYTAYGRAAQAIEQTGALPVPLHIRNAPTKLMKNLDYGKGYKYAHNFEDAVVDMECLPEELQGRKFYTPSDRGYEKIIKERMEYIAKKKKERR
ncbi:MAG: replication-associated recombination protein A [Proteobacteria bacterium]|nr:replication-associated recombination protein A [Pseudomonadota bacterium]